MKTNAILSINVVSTTKMIWKTFFQLHQVFRSPYGYVMQTRTARLTCNKWKYGKRYSMSRQFKFLVENLLKFLPWITLPDRFTLTVAVAVRSSMCFFGLVCIPVANFRHCSGKCWFSQDPCHGDISYRKNQIMILINRFYQSECTLGALPFFRGVRFDIIRLLLWCHNEHFEKLLNLVWMSLWSFARWQYARLTKFELSHMKCLLIFLIKVLFFYYSFARLLLFVIAKSDLCVASKKKKNKNKNPVNFFALHYVAEVLKGKNWPCVK